MRFGNERAFALLEALPCIVLLAGLALALGSVAASIGEENELSSVLDGCAREAALEGDLRTGAVCLEAALSSAGVPRGSWHAAVTAYGLTIDPGTGRLVSWAADGGVVAGGRSGIYRPSAPASVAGRGGTSGYALRADPLPGYFPFARALVVDLFPAGRPALSFSVPFPVDSHAPL